MGYTFWIILSMLKWQFTMITATVTHSPLLFLLSIIGGILGIVLFTQIGLEVERWLIKTFPKMFRRFSWKNRKLARLRRKWGIIGISILTPILISIPIGIIICLTLTSDKMKIIRPMIISLLTWSSIFLMIALII